MVTIQFKKLSESATVPTRGSDFAAGYDLYSTEDFLLLPSERKLFKTNIAMAIPSGLYGRIAPRSGLAFKDGIDTLAGVIDEDYRGDVGVILINFGNTVKEIKKGDKIAQIIFEHYNAATFQEVAELPASVRSEGGFGSTDKKVGWADGGLKPVVDQKDQTVTGTVVDGYAGPKPGKSLADLYQKSGGVPVKKRYSEEIKERDQS
jgi:dUTP pyrophosphatase